MALRVNGGIISNQTLTGGMRFFKITGPFEWAVSDGSVNLPVFTTGGATPVTSYFVVGNNRPVPNSAADIVLREVSKKAGIIIIGLLPASYGDTTELHIALSASALGWGSDDPAYDAPPADADEKQLPDTPTGAETEMQAAIQALPNATVYITAGAPDDPTQPPVSTVVVFGGVTVEEVSFSLGTTTYYNLA